jgi:hypothetical protein
MEHGLALSADALFRDGPSRRANTHFTAQRVLCEMLVVAQLFSKSSFVYGTRNTSRLATLYTSTVWTLGSNLNSNTSYSH